jgi:hypothetical protein
MLTISVIRTSIYEGSGFDNELISFGSGDYLNDTVGIGGVATPHILFGYIDNIGFPDQIPYPASSIAGEHTLLIVRVRKLISPRHRFDLPRQRTTLRRGRRTISSPPAEERFYHQQGRGEHLPRAQ